MAASACPTSPGRRRTAWRSIEARLAEAVSNRKMVETRREALREKLDSQKRAGTPSRMCTTDLERTRNQLGSARVVAARPADEVHRGTPADPVGQESNRRADESDVVRVEGVRGLDPLAVGGAAGRAPELLGSDHRAGVDPPDDAGSRRGAAAAGGGAPPKPEGALRRRGRVCAPVARRREPARPVHHAFREADGGPDPGAGGDEGRQGH